jgi:hypothetical protein
MREDIASVVGVDGWVRVTCDADGCANSIDYHVRGRPPEGWAQDVPLIATTSSVKDYCPAHADLAT